MRALAAVACVAVVGVLIWHFSSGGNAQAQQRVPTSTAPVVRTNVVERQQVAGTLSFAGSFGVVNAGDAGIVTWLPQAGAVVRRGGTLYGLDRSPVILLYGDRPAYRDLTLGDEGQDVRALQENLLALGFDAGGTVAVDHRFDVPTLAAVEALQRSRGLQPSGTFALGSLVFLPGPSRVGSLATAAGASVPTGAAILTATSARPAVLVPLDPGNIGRIAVGDRVLVTLPDGTTAQGRVSGIGRSATAAPANGNPGDSTPTVPVTVELLGPHTGGLDQAPVQVSITEREDDHVLAVPISALLAQPGGGYAVEVVSTAWTMLVPVTTALFDDVAGKVEVSGAGLSPGVRVEVPSG